MLEDGDNLFIPKLNSTITIVGNVLNSNDLETNKAVIRIRTEKVIEKAGDDKIIVMRSSDMSPLKRYFKGSIPLSIMNRCNVPILIVK